MFDVLVVGGGIQGAGVAHAAAAAGYKVLLVEQSALAAGTSSRSSKLIHGGLRYLETGQFGLVRECLHERQLLLKLAPELVKLTPHYIPVYPSTRRRPWQIRTGLSIYAMLGGMSRNARFATVPIHYAESLDGLRPDGLQKVFHYYDGQTDDVALTRAVVAAARRLGAELAMPAEFAGAEWRHDYWSVQLADSSGQHAVYTSTIVNAAGPWVNDVTSLVSPPIVPESVELVAGTHLLFKGTVGAVYYVEAPRDGRAVFVMPWHDGQIMVGTTEREYHGDPALVAPTQAEIDYLCETFGYYFPVFREVEPCGAFAGLRVLPSDDHHSPFERARETNLKTAQEGRWLAIYGGKLTAYRATGDKVLRQLKRVLPRREPLADTATDPLFFVS